MGLTTLRGESAHPVAIAADESLTIQTDQGLFWIQEDCVSGFANLYEEHAYQLVGMRGHSAILRSVETREWLILDWLRREVVTWSCPWPVRFFSLTAEKQPLGIMMDGSQQPLFPRDALRPWQGSLIHVAGLETMPNQNPLPLPDVSLIGDLDWFFLQRVSPKARFPRHALTRLGLEWLNLWEHRLRQHKAPTLPDLSQWARSLSRHQDCERKWLVDLGAFLEIQQIPVVEPFPCKPSDPQPGQSWFEGQLARLPFEQSIAGNTVEEAKRATTCLFEHFFHSCHQAQPHLFPLVAPDLAHWVVVAGLLQSRDLMNQICRLLITRLPEWRWEDLTRVWHRLLWFGEEAVLDQLSPFLAAHYPGAGQQALEIQRLFFQQPWEEERILREIETVDHPESQWRNRIQWGFWQEDLDKVLAALENVPQTVESRQDLVDLHAQALLLHGRLEESLAVLEASPSPWPIGRGPKICLLRLLLGKKAEDDQGWTRARPMSFCLLKQLEGLLDPSGSSNQTPGDEDPFWSQVFIGKCVSHLKALLNGVARDQEDGEPAIPLRHFRDQLLPGSVHCTLQEVAHLLGKGDRSSLKVIRLFHLLLFFASQWDQAIQASKWGQR
jgi:hypothetical protein